MTRVARWKTPAAAVLSGVLFALAFPPFELVLLLPLALVPWLVALSKEESRARALLSGFLFGMAYWCLSIPWIIHVVTRFGGQGGVMGIVCLLLLAAILAEWPALAAWGAVAAAPAGSPFRFFAFTLLWTATEHARSFIYGGFPWNLTGHALFRHPVWLQSASVWGVFGLGALAVGISALLARAVLTRRLHAIMAAGALTLAVGAIGAFRLARSVPGGGPLTVALLQPNVSQETRLSGGDAEAYAAVLGQAREAAAARPDLIVFPESALPAYWDSSTRLRRDLSEVARDSSVIFNDIEQEPDGSYYNVARLLGPAGLVGRPYRKVHLVPFGEYVPLPRLFFFVRQVSTEIGEFSAAPRPALLAEDGLRVGMGVCYEILYPGLAREEVGPLSANLLVTISNDSWYGRAGAQEQHFAGAVLRAVENERYLLRAAVTGVSGVVDERGRIRAELGRDRSGIVTARARLCEGATIWTRWGYWLPRLCDAGALVVLLFGLVRWKRARNL